MKTILRLTPLGLIAVSAPALAHPGHDHGSGFAAGLLHPLTGADHMLAMLMVGLWAGLAFPRHWWVCPAAFVSFMLAGFVYGANGGALPIAEILILASLVGLGMALVFEARPPLAISAGIVALFAIGHGFAHGAEMRRGVNSEAFAAGFVITTALIHAVGLGVTRMTALRSPRRVGQAVGVAATLTAATMMWSS